MVKRNESHFNVILQAVAIPIAIQLAAHQFGQLQMG